MQESDNQLTSVGPKCERMKSRNESFDNENDRYPSRSSRGDNDDNEVVDQNNSNNNYSQSSDQDCMKFFDTTQFLNNGARGRMSAAAATPTHNYPHDAETELQQAMAYSGALVGENVLDSPESAREERSTRPGRSSTILPCLRDGSFRSAIPPNNSNNKDRLDPGISAGLVAQGFAWVRSQRESRRRRYLQYQAEQQLRKIQAAQNAQRNKEAINGNKGLFANSIFLNMVSSSARGSSDAGDNHNNKVDRGGNSKPDGEILDESIEAEDAMAPQATVSQSGAGYSVELDVSMSEEEEDASWIPPVRIEEEYDAEEGASLCLLSEDQRQQVAQHVLPTGIAYAKWRRIYSLARDGDSFETCLRLVKDYNQSLLIIRTSKNEILGGFADDAWEQPSLAGAQFYGGPGSCLFSVPDPTKSKVLAYKWTGANRYIQLTDNHRKLLAFGGGGKEGSFGLCVESDFQRGSTGHCDTFGNEPLCSEENFSIVELEIFGFLLGQF